MHVRLSDGHRKHRQKKEKQTVPGYFFITSVAENEYVITTSTFHILLYINHFRSRPFLRQSKRLPFLIPR